LRRDDPDYSRLESRPGRIGDPTVRAVLDGQRVAAWYRQGEDVRAIVAAAYPIEDADPRLGAVLVEQVSDSILTLARTNQAMTRLIATSVIVSLLVAAGLLAYASFLSFRVGRLSRAAETALGPRGEINASLPGTKAGDEIGDLSRSFGDLLGRLRDYTDYLQSLKSKLSHELRTPLAIVATSVDNLEHETTTESARAYLARLRHGTERLESILQAMTAATRVEQAITETELERFDLGAVVASCVSAYRDVYARRSFEASLPDEPVHIDGSADLIEQLLDKLIDNAVSFATEGPAIEIDLDAGAKEARLSVVNRGPLLPDAMRHQLFDSLVSVRTARGEKPHLGLGLYIVTLIAEFHRGRVEAENLPDGTGVAIRVVLPRSDAGPA
jgi:two-component system sensor histidine kinase ChvG